MEVFNISAHQYIKMQKKRYNCLDRGGSSSSLQVFVVRMEIQLNQLELELCPHNGEGLVFLIKTHGLFAHQGNALPVT